MHSSQLHSSIIAQCTPHGSGAIALLRLSGENAFTIADAISKLPGQKKISTQPTHTIHYGWVVGADGAHIDQVLFLLMRAPHTFTGDDTIEITCHNNPFIIQNILSTAIAAGARLAQEGEFSRRAVENNKIDILQAEAINDLIHANTQLALKQSLSQLEGSFTQWITLLEKQLIKALALSEASFEFIDEENMEFNIQIKEIIDEVLATSNRLKNAFDQQQQIRQGIRIAIIGSVNAGKSSLFNKLLQQNRAIVTNIAGTTRDAIEAGLYKNNNYWTLIDTAGLRTTDDIIEQMGITRSHEEAHKADIILLVFDSSQALTESEITVYQDLLTSYANKIIIINNKTDLPLQYNPLLHNKSIISTSSCARSELVEEYPRALEDTLLPQFSFYSKPGTPSKETEDGDKTVQGEREKNKKLLSSNSNDSWYITSNEAIESAIQSKISHLFSSIESPFLLNQRHYNALLSLENKLALIFPMLTTNPQYELISYHLNDALAMLSELTGKTISEAGMDAVFREFCVGK